MLLLSSADFFQNKLFQKIISGKNVGPDPCPNSDIIIPQWNVGVFALYTCLESGDNKGRR